MIQPVHTTLTPILAPDDPKHRAELAVYLGDGKVSTVLLELDDPPVCDRCGAAVCFMAEVEVDEHGCRHEGECPEPTPWPAVSGVQATSDEVAGVEGRRIPDGKWWDDDAHPGVWRVGDYCLDEDKGHVRIQIPYGEVGVPVHIPTQHAASDVAGPRWELTENDDDTLTLSPSINCEGVWHGWLTAGALVTA
jgi:hypothetical protein